MNLYAGGGGAMTHAVHIRACTHGRAVFVRAVLKGPQEVSKDLRDITMVGSADGLKRKFPGGDRPPKVGALLDLDQAKRVQ